MCISYFQKKCRLGFDQPISIHTMIRSVSHYSYYIKDRLLIAHGYHTTRRRYISSIKNITPIIVRSTWNDDNNNSNYSTNEDSSNIFTKYLKLKSANSESPAPTIDDLSNADNVAELNEEEKKCKEMMDGNKSYFPWRHSTIPLNRLNPEHPEFVTKGPSGEGWPVHVQTFQLLYVGRELGLPLWKTILTKQWQEDLASEFARAFSIAVATLVSGRFGVPIKMVMKDDDTFSVAFDSTNVDMASRKTTSKTDDINDDDLSDINTIEPTNESEVNNESKEEDKAVDENMMLEAMLEENLQKLYLGARDFGNANSMQIKLETRPISSKLISANVVPFVTREDVKIKPTLKGSLLDLRDQFANVAKSRDSVNDLLLEARKWFEKETGHKERRTVVLQAEIICKETFYVRDMASDTIIQGNLLGAEQTVTHVVRFEMVTNEGEVDRIPLISILGPPEKRILGSWKIADWDDLLDGNIWYKN